MARLFRSFKWAAQGLQHCVKREKNFQVHCVLAVLAVVLGVGLKISILEWILIFMSIATVLALEMINTAIEHLCNIVHPGAHPTIKVIKDVSAAAVLVIALMAVFCGAVIFIPKIISLF